MKEFGIEYYREKNMLDEQIPGWFKRFEYVNYTTDKNDNPLKIVSHVLTEKAADMQNLCEKWSDNRHKYRPHVFKTFGKLFLIRLTTQSIEHANTFCEENKDCGVIAEIDGIIYVAELAETKLVFTNASVVEEGF